MRRLYALLERVAPSRASVVITGESGTGKERAAAAIHAASPRAAGPFVAINCSAIAPTLIESELFGYERGAFTGADQRRPGCFERAHGGTLLLDELGDMPLEMQAKLLRVLEERRVRRLGGREELPVDVRVLAATHRDLLRCVEEGRFRQDLYFRLNVFQVEMPPLRTRREDIPALAEHLARRIAREEGRTEPQLQRDFLAALIRHDWPGNVRELRNVVQRAVLMSDDRCLSAHHLPPSMAVEPAHTEEREPPIAIASEERLGGPLQLVPPASHAEEPPEVELVPSDEPARPSDAEVRTSATVRLPVGLPLEDVERLYIEATLASVGGHKRRAAAVLGISDRTLSSRLLRVSASGADA